MCFVAGFLRIENERNSTLLSYFHERGHDKHRYP